MLLDFFFDEVFSCKFIHLRNLFAYIIDMMVLKFFQCGDHIDRNNITLPCAQNKICIVISPVTEIHNLFIVLKIRAIYETCFILQVVAPKSKFAV